MDKKRFAELYGNFELFAHSTCADGFTHYYLENGKVAFVKSDEL